MVDYHCLADMGWKGRPLIRYMNSDFHNTE